MTTNENTPDEIRVEAVAQDDDRALEGADAVDRVEVEIAATGDEGSSAMDSMEAELVVDEEVELSDAELILQLREELATTQALVDEHVDRLQRTAAEFQNARRRQERQLSDAIDRANAELIRRLLPIVDDLDLAFASAPEAEEGAEGQGGELAWMQGFRQIRKKLLDLLAEQGVSPIDATGAFDPMLHEAVLSEASDEVESGHIVDVLRTGYEYKGQVLRPAMVRVAA